MGSFSGVGIGLSLVFGCILLGLVAELYYVLWWKKRFTQNRVFQNHYSKHAADLSYLFCWNKPNSTNSSSKPQTPTPEVTTTTTTTHGDEQQDPELGLGNDLLLKGAGEEGVDSELMRLHNLCGPPRFLFTIKEETKEDLSDTPFLSPLSSPPLKAQALVDSCNRHGFNFNPLFESSPPPKFKFLRDAEEKLMRRLMEETEKRVLKNGGSVQDSAIKAPPTPSQVLPLASSPST